MTDAGSHDAVMLLIVGVAAIAGSWLDLRYRRIPNWLCLVTALFGLLLAVLDGHSVVGSHAIHLTIALICGMVLFRLGMFGGGDAKFYAAMASFFPLSKAVALLVSVSLSGVVLLVIWFTWRRIAGVKLRSAEGGGIDSLPYGVAIGAGTLIAFLLG